MKSADGNILVKRLGINFKVVTLVISWNTIYNGIHVKMIQYLNINGPSTIRFCEVVLLFCWALGLYVHRGDSERLPHVYRREILGCDKVTGYMWGAVCHCVSCCRNPSLFLSLYLSLIICLFFSPFLSCRELCMHVFCVSMRSTFPPTDACIKGVMLSK